MKALFYFIRAVLLCTPFWSSATPPWSAKSVQSTAATAPCANPGRDGSPTALAGVVNTYFPATASAAVGATSISVGASSGAATAIAAGDLLLVIQMQGADVNNVNTNNYGANDASGGGNLSNANFTAGTYEYVVASTGLAAGTVGTITLTTGLVNAYSQAAATTAVGQRSFQVVRIPQYSNVTLGGTVTAQAWNGKVGGIIALDVAGVLNLNGSTIDVSGAGFRGGAGRILTGDATTGLAATDYRTAASINANGQKGEGTAGTPQYVNNNGTLLDTGIDGYPGGSGARGAPGNAGGGGTDGLPTTNNQNTGGGGGANGGSGGRGGNAWSSGTASGGQPGAAFLVASTSRLVLGGGGGAGTSNDGTGTPAAGFASSGAAGGGLILVRTGSVSGTGSILANGANANNTVLNDGSGGGGAGGSILVTATNSQAGLGSLTLKANGGTGGTNMPGADPHGPGGGGGGGVILSTGAVAVASAATGGANGVTNNTTTPAGAYGAAAGTTGVSNAAISNTITNSTAGANCMANTNPLPVVLIAFAAQAVQNRDALLSWTTASEVNSAYFDVERSLDGVSFRKVGQLAARGTSTSPSNYTFTDAGIGARAQGVVYYRLRQVDRDATASSRPYARLASRKPSWP